MNYSTIICQPQLRLGYLVFLGQAHSVPSMGAHELDIKYEIYNEVAILLRQA